MMPDWTRPSTYKVGSPRGKVRLIPPVYVKPFVKRGKKDAAHAEVISEANASKWVTTDHQFEARRAAQ